MRYLTCLAALLVLSTDPAGAQEAPDSISNGALEAEVLEVIERSGMVAAVDTIAARSAPELQAALDRLSTTLSVLADRVANDRELQESALRGAAGFVELAQLLVVREGNALLEVLRSAAGEIGEPESVEEAAAGER